MLKFLAIALVLLAGTGLPCAEQLTMKDGKVLVGDYDAEQGTILVTKGGLKASIKINADDIVSRETVEESGADNVEEIDLLNNKDIHKVITRILDLESDIREFDEAVAGISKDLTGMAKDKRTDENWLDTQRLSDRRQFMLTKGMVFRSEIWRLAIDKAARSGTVADSLKDNRRLRDEGKTNYDLEAAARRYFQIRTGIGKIQEEMREISNFQQGTDSEANLDQVRKQRLEQAKEAKNKLWIEECQLNARHQAYVLLNADYECLSAKEIVYPRQLVPAYNMQVIAADKEMRSWCEDMNKCKGMGSLSSLMAKEASRIEGSLVYENNVAKTAIMYRRVTGRALPAPLWLVSECLDQDKAVDGVSLQGKTEGPTTEQLADIAKMTKRVRLLRDKLEKAKTKSMSIKDTSLLLSQWDAERTELVGVLGDEVARKAGVQDEIAKNASLLKAGLTDFDLEQSARRYMELVRQAEKIKAEIRVLEIDGGVGTPDRSVRKADGSDKKGVAAFKDDLARLEIEVGRLREMHTRYIFRTTSFDCVQGDVHVRGRPYVVRIQKRNGRTTGVYAAKRSWSWSAEAEDGVRDWCEKLKNEQRYGALTDSASERLQSFLNFYDTGRNGQFLTPLIYRKITGRCFPVSLDVCGAVLEGRDGK